MLLDIGAERISALPTNPLPTTPRDFMETLALSYEADRSTTASDSRTRNNLAEYDRAADELVTIGFNSDMTPLPPPAAGAGGAPPVKITGTYEARAAFAGAADGKYGFFKRADGAIMVCAWLGSILA